MNVAKEDLLEGLLLKAIDSIDELNKTTTLQSARLDQYNGHLEEHMKRSDAIENIAIAAMAEAKAAINIARNPCEFALKMKAEMDALELQSVLHEKEIISAKPTITIAHRVITWVKVTAIVIAALTPFVAAAWAIFKYWHQIAD